MIASLILVALVASSQSSLAAHVPTPRDCMNQFLPDALAIFFKSAGLGVEENLVLATNELQARFETCTDLRNESEGDACGRQALQHLADTVSADPALVQIAGDVQVVVGNVLECVTKYSSPTATKVFRSLKSLADQTCWNKVDSYASAIHAKYAKLGLQDEFEHTTQELLSALTTCTESEVESEGDACRRLASQQFVETVSAQPLLTFLAQDIVVLVGKVLHCYFE